MAKGEYVTVVLMVVTDVLDMEDDEREEQPVR
jgi:hypothetical protein